MPKEVSTECFSNHLSYRLSMTAVKRTKMVAKTEGWDRLGTVSEPSLGGHCSVDFRDQE